MAHGYVLRLALVWGTLPLAVVSAFACLATSVALIATNGFDDLPAQLFAGAAVVLLLYRLLYGTRGATARVLAGGFPCALFCCGGPAPRNEDELHDAIRKLMPEGGASLTPSVVGAGWGWWTMRTSTPGKRLFTHRLVGRPDPKGDPFCFWAGTSLYALTQTLLDDPACRVPNPDTGERVPSTLWSHPSISDISLGGWLGPSAHGSAGDSGYGSSHAVRLGDGIEVWNMRMVARGESGYSQRVGYEQLRLMMDEDVNASEYLVVRVHFDPARLSPNRMVQTELVVVEDADSATEYLKPGRILSVLLVGSARKHALGLRYTKVYDDDTRRPLITCCPCLPCTQQHIDPHDCSRDCRAAQLDTCSFIGGWYERSLNVWRGRATLRDANLFTPLSSPPSIMLIAPCGGIYNFEIFCRLPAGTPMTGAWLYQLLTALHDGFQETRGRAEIRNGKLSNSVLFLDIGIGQSGFEMPFRVLKSLGIKVAALHTSKYQGEELKEAARKSRVRLVSPYALYFEKAVAV